MNFRTAHIQTEAELNDFMRAATDGTLAYYDLDGAQVSPRTAVENWCGDWFCPHLAMWADADGFEAAALDALETVQGLTVELHEVRHA